jgi:hypothetical protein
VADDHGTRIQFGAVENQPWSKDFLTPRKLPSQQSSQSRPLKARFERAVNAAARWYIYEQKATNQGIP